MFVDFKSQLQWVCTETIQRERALERVMSRHVSCKDAFLSCSKIVLVMYVCLSMTEKPQVGPTCMCLCCWRCCVKCFCVPLFLTWLVQSLCWLKSAPAWPRRFPAGGCLQLLVPSQPLCCSRAGYRDGLYSSWREGAWNCRRGFIPVYGGEESKYKFLTWIGKLCFQNVQIRGVSDFIGLGSAPGVARISKSLFQVRKENLNQHYYP